MTEAAVQGSNQPFSDRSLPTRGDGFLVDKLNRAVLSIVTSLAEGIGPCTHETLPI